MDIVDKLYKQLEILSQHKDFNESCTIIDIIDATKELDKLRAKVEKILARELAASERYEKYCVLAESKISQLENEAIFNKDTINIMQTMLEDARAEVAELEHTVKNVNEDNQRLTANADRVEKILNDKVAELEYINLGLKQFLELNTNSNVFINEILKLNTQLDSIYALPAVAWQFYQQGEWWLGSDMNNHKQNTIDAGIEIRDVYALLPRGDA